MKRTPRSARRRASRQFEANDPSPGLAPYISSTLAGSLLMSTKSGTLDCMRKAISYCATRVRISGSWVALYSRRFSAFTAWTDSLCAASLTPGGFRTCSTASPKELSFTPWKRLGRMPLDHWRAAMGCIWPPLPEDISTTKRSEEHTSELQSLRHLVCRLLLEKK